jgi:hypothetical protein
MLFILVFSFLCAERSFGIHTGHNTAGNIRSFVANPFTEFKILTFGPMGKIAK